MAFAKDENMVESLPPDRANETLGEGILPRPLGRGQHFGDPHADHASPERLPVNAVAIAEDIAWAGLVREGVHDLLRGPLCSWVLGHVEVHDASAVMSEDDEHEEDAQARGRAR